MLIALKRTLYATFAVIIAILLPVTGQAATYYVATTGSNSNPGTSSSPWRTVAYAVSKMIAGDTTYVWGGIYKEGTIQFLKSGTSSAPIKLLSAPGQFPIIDFVDQASGKMIIVGSSKISRGWITIEGFEIKNGHHAIKIINGYDITIRRNWIHHNRNSGILGNGLRVLIDRNRINRNAHGTSSPGGHGIYASGTAFTITNNLIYDNWTYGIQMNGSASYDPTRYTSQEFAASANWKVINNTIAYNVNRSGIVVWGSTCNNAWIENNIFYENAVKLASYETQGISFSGTTCKGIRIINNISFASGSGAKTFLGTGAKEGIHYTQSGNIVNTLKPTFINAPATLPSSPNFALSSGSSAIDKGQVNSSAKTAYNGITRPKGLTYDVGAYEYNGSTSQLLLAAPTSAQAQ